MFPIRGQPQGAAHREHSRQQRHEFRLNQAALVMTLLVPGIGKENVDQLDGAGRKLLL